MNGKVQGAERLALGTAQFGLAYGAFNAGDARVSDGEACRILAVAQAAGIDTLDTARAYGEAEAVLGRLGAPGRFRVVTKISALRGAGAAAVRTSFAASLTALATDRVTALLLHDADDLLARDGPEVWDVLAALRESGIVGKVGVSVYDPDQARRILERFGIGAMQLPMNIFDNRFAEAGVLDACARADVEVHARSVFLQGFVLADPGALPAHLMPYAPALTAFRQECAERGLAPASAAIAHVAAHPVVSRILVGCETAAQLGQAVAALGPPAPCLGHADQPPALIDPRLWQREAA